MSEERLQILRMVAEGKVSADEAARLLETLDEKQQGPDRQRPRWLRIRVHGESRDVPKVNVNLPLSLLDVALAFIPEGVRVNVLNRLGGGDVDLKALLQVLKEEGAGKIIEVTHEEEGIRIEVTVE